MAEEASRVVVALLADTGNFDTKVRGSAASFGKSMDDIERSADRAEKSTSGALAKVNTSLDRSSNVSKRLGLQIGQIGSQLAVGTSPFVIFAQQASDVSLALEGTGGKLGKVIGFLGTWQGAVLLAAGAMAAQFIPKLLESEDALDDLVQKLKEDADKTRDAERAKELFARSLEGVEQAADKAEEAIEALRLAQKGEAAQTVENIRKNLDDAEALRISAQATVAKAKAILELRKQEAARNPVNLEQGISQELEVGRQAKALETLQNELDRATSSADRLRKAYVEAVSYQTVEREMRSAEDKINDRYDAMIDGAAKAADASKKSQDALAAETRRINEAREAELKRLRDIEQARRKSASALPQVTGREIAAALGTTINSGTRSAERNKAVGGSKNSYHLSGQAIDIPLTVNGKPLTKAGIRAALEPLGVEIKELLGPGDKGHNDHFHIAFGKRRLGPDQIADRQQREADRIEREINEELRRRQSFENELASLTGDEIDARQALITSAEEIAKLETEAIELSRKKYDDNLNALVEQKKLTDDEAAQLRAINDERAKLRTELVKRREDERKFRMAEAERQRQAEFGGAVRSDQADILQGQLDLARTQKQRRELELRLLDLQYAEEKARNDYLIGYYERLKTQEGISESELAEAKAAAEIAQLRNNSIEQRKGQDQQGTLNATQSPLGDYFDRIPQTADEINEALKSVAAGGLATFTDALTDAIVNFSSLGDVGLAVLRQLTAGLVRMAIQQVILRTIGQSAGAAAVAATSAQAAAAGAAWAGPAALASLATLGANAGPAALALTSTTALATALGAVPKKDGGRIFGRGGPRDDKVLMAASPDEFMIKARSAAKIGYGTLDYINRTGELPAFRDGGAVARGYRPGNASLSMDGGSAELSADAVRQLEGVVTRAIDAMPNVNLYPTMNPKAAMESMLNDPGARRVLFGWMQDNSGRVNNNLQR